MPSHGSGGGYDGPLAYRMGKPMQSRWNPHYERLAGDFVASLSPRTYGISISSV
jgi:hypothetical protein